MPIRFKSDAHDALQPPVLINRFLIDLRSLDTSNQLSTDGGVPNLSHFSVNFRIPETTLGNIGESLDYDLSEGIDESDELATEAEHNLELTNLGQALDGVGLTDEKVRGFTHLGRRLTAYSRCYSFRTQAIRRKCKNLENSSSLPSDWPQQALAIMY